MKVSFSELKDEKLMLLYQEGEYLAFETLYHRHKAKIYSYLRKRIKEASKVDDIFQNTFTKLHKSRDKYDSKHPFMAWLYTICRSEMLDYIRKNKTQYEELKEEQLVIDENKTSDFPIHFQDEKSLNENEKKALELRYYSEQEFEEIAKTLKTTSSNIRKIISRGLQKLRLKYNGGLNESK